MVVCIYIGLTYLCGDILSCRFLGGHLNPAVTFALCLLGRERWMKFPVYFAFQTLGAFLGSGVIFGLYYGEGQAVP